MKAIDTVYFSSIGDFCDDFVAEYDELPEDHRSISVLASYEDTVEILKELMLYNFTVAQIELDMPELAGDMEYYTDLSNGELWVYPAINSDDEYYENDAYVGYIHGDANFKAIQAYCDAWSVREYAIEEQDEDENDMCEDCADKYDCEDSSLRKAADKSEAKDKTSAEIKDDETDDGMKGFFVTKNTDNGYRSYSFYSTDDDYVDDMREFVKKLFNM